jgi:hypothetical protein
VLDILVAHCARVADSERRPLSPEAAVADQNTTPWTLPVPREAVAENVGESYWSVDEFRWDRVEPTLPEDLIALLAPPVVVGAMPVGG